MCCSAVVFQSMAYMVSGNMDRGIKEYQLEAAISKVYGSVSGDSDCRDRLGISSPLF